MDQEQIASIVRNLQILEAAGDEQSLDAAAKIRAQLERDPFLAEAAVAVRLHPRLSTNQSQVEKSIVELEGLGVVGQARAGELRQSLVNRQRLGAIDSGFAEVGSTLNDQLSQFGTDISTGIGRTLNSVTDLGSRALGASTDLVNSGIDAFTNSGPVQSALDFVNPADQARKAIADLQVVEQAAGLSPQTGQPLTPQTGQNLPDAPIPTSPAPAPGVLAGQTLGPNLNVIQEAIRQQAAATTNQLELSRLADQIRLQSVPQIDPNTLNAAAALAVPAPITSAPASISNSIRTVNSVSPDVNIQSLAPAASANIRQRQQTNRVQDQANDRLLREQQRAFELAQRQYIDDVLKPIFARPRN